MDLARDGSVGGDDLRDVSLVDAVVPTNTPIASKTDEGKNTSLKEVVVQCPPDLLTKKTNPGWPRIRKMAAKVFRAVMRYSLLITCAVVSMVLSVTPDMLSLAAGSAITIMAHLGEILLTAFVTAEAWSSGGAANDAAFAAMGHRNPTNMRLSRWRTYPWAFLMAACVGFFPGLSLIRHVALVCGLARLMVLELTTFANTPWEVYDESLLTPDFVTEYGKGKQLSTYGRCPFTLVPGCERREHMRRGGGKDANGRPLKEFVAEPTFALFQNGESQSPICLELLAAMKMKLTTVIDPKDNEKTVNSLVRLFAENPMFNIGPVAEWPSLDYNDICYHTAACALDGYNARRAIHITGRGVLQVDRWKAMFDIFDNRRRFYTRRIVQLGLGATLIMLGLKAAAQLGTQDGYVYSQVPRQLQAKALPEQSPDGKISDALYDTSADRTETVARSVFSGIVPNPRPAKNNGSNHLDAIRYRLNTLLPNASEFKIDKLRNQTSSLLAQIRPLVTIPDVKAWLESTSYSARRRLAIFDGWLSGAKRNNSAFIKSESYPTFKPPRAIVNASQAYKNIEGPVVQAVDEQLKKFKSFLKDVPVSSWMDIVTQDFESLPGMTFVTDFTSFESSPSKSIKNAVENQFYDHVLRFYPDIAAVLTEEQTKVRSFVLGSRRYARQGGRFSGDQRTSQANTLLNYIVNLCVLSDAGVDQSRMFISGDDGLIRVPWGTKLEPSMWAQYGFNIKIVQTDVLTSGFCGFRAVHTDRGYERFSNLAVSVADFVWCDKAATRKDMMSLLAAKAYSVMCQYPGDVVLRTLAAVFLSTSTSVPTMSDTYWTKHLLEDARIEYKLDKGKIVLQGELLSSDSLRDALSWRNATLQAVNSGLNRSEVLHLAELALRAGLTLNGTELDEWTERYGLRDSKVREHVQRMVTWPETPGVRQILPKFQPIYRENWAAWSPETQAILRQAGVQENRRNRLLALFR